MKPTEPTDLPVRFSNLKRIAPSPAHYLHAITTPTKPTKLMRLGTLVHYGVLGAAFDDDERPIVIYDGERRGNDWKKFELDAPPNAEIFTAAEVAESRPIVAAVLADEVAGQLLQGERERKIAWSIGSRACSSRLDVVGRFADGGRFVADLKVTNSAHPRAFQGHALKSAWHAQLAFYVDACAAIDIDARDAYLVAVESKAPYPVTCFRLTPRLLDEGRRMYRAWFELLRTCESSNDWPAYALHAVEFDIPDWMMPRDEADEDEGDDEEVADVATP